MDRAQKEQESIFFGTWRKNFTIVTESVLIVTVVCFSFILALQRTIPSTSPQVNEEMLQTTIASICQSDISELDAITFQESFKSRDLANNRDYYEYDYEYVQSEVCYTGHLTVCYEYDGAEWRLVSIAITDLDERK